VGKCRITAIKVEQLGDVMCPYCGRYYSEGCIETTFHSNEAKEEYRPMCIRCFLGAPEIKEMAMVGNNEQMLSVSFKKTTIKPIATESFPFSFLFMKTCKNDGFKALEKLREQNFEGVKKRL
jgi:hypothetical protein